MMSATITSTKRGVMYRPITFNVKHALFAMVVSCGAYGFFLLLSVLLVGSNVSDSTGLAFVHTGGAVALIAFWKLGRWGRARYDCFGAALLLVAVVFRLHALVDVLAYGTRVESIFIGVPLSDPVISMFLKGEAITVLGLLLVACAWRLGVGSRVEHFSFTRGAQRVPLKVALVAYLAALSVNVLDRVLGATLGALQQLASLTFTFGVAAIYFVAAQRAAVSAKVGAAIALAIPMVLLALGSGMKEEIFFPLIPAGLLYWFGYRSIPAKGLAVAGLIVLLSIAQLYVQHVRQTAWRSTGNLEVPTGELLQSFGQAAGRMDISNALDSISSRVNLTTTHAITVSLADHQGYEPVEVFGMIPASVIPRLLWSGKPVMQPGVLHTARVQGINVEFSEIRSATAAGFAAELYLGGGWFGVLLGAATYGVFLAWAQKWTLWAAPGFGHQALCFLTLYWTLRFDEKHVVYAYTSIVLAIVFIWLMKRAASLLGLEFEAAERRRSA